MKTPRLLTLLPCLLCLAPLLLPAPARAQSLRLLDRYLGPQRGVAVDPLSPLFSHLAYVPGDAQLAIIDRSNPERPRRIATLSLPASCRDLAARDGYVYIAANDAGMLVVDARIPDRPRIAAQFATFGAASGIDLIDTSAGTMALLADGSGGLLVVDVSDPPFPDLRAIVPVGSPLLDVAVSGDLAFLAFDYCGPSPLSARPGVEPAFIPCRLRLAVFDFANPLDPALVSQIDLSTPLLGSLGDAPARVLMQTLPGNRLALAVPIAGLALIELTPLNFPTLLNVYRPAGFEAARGLAADGDRLFLLDQDNALRAIDVSNPAAPVVLDETPPLLNDGPTAFPFPIEPNRLAVAGDTLLAATGFSGLQIHDIAATDTLRRLSIFDPPDYAYGLTAAGAAGSEVVILADGFFNFFADARLVFFDPDPSASPDPYDARPGSAVRIPAVAPSPDGTRIHFLRQTDLADNWALRTISRDASSSPSLLSDHALPAPASGYKGLATGGGMLLVTDAGRLRVYGDDPAALPLLFDFPTIYGNRILLDGDRLLLANRGGLQILEVSPTAPPFQLSVLPPPFPEDGSHSLVGPDGLCRSGSIVYLSAGEFGIRIVDIADPEDPVERAAIPAVGSVGGLALAGDLLFAADSAAGLLVYDVSDPDAPQSLRSLPSPAPAADVAVAGGRVYLASSFGGLAVYELQIPAAAQPASLLYP